jgi:hypothetical protein
MRLTKTEEYRSSTEATISLFVFLALAVGAYFLGDYFINKVIVEDRSIRDATISVLETNRKDAKEIKFLRENEEAIETMWSTLKSWGTGVSDNSVLPLTEAGLDNKAPLPPTKVPGNPTEYVGMKILGDRTEFQRFVDALSLVETQEGLMQIRAAQLSLPGTVEPNAERPIYLNIMIEAVGPIAR